DSPFHGSARAPAATGTGRAGYRLRGAPPESSGPGPPAARVGTPAVGFLSRSETRRSAGEAAGRFDPSVPLDAQERPIMGTLSFTRGPSIFTQTVHKSSTFVDFPQRALQTNTTGPNAPLGGRPNQRSGILGRVDVPGIAFGGHSPDSSEG